MENDDQKQIVENFYSLLEQLEKYLSENDWTSLILQETADLCGDDLNKLYGMLFDAVNKKISKSATFNEISIENIKEIYDNIDIILSDEKINNLLGSAAFLSAYFIERLSQEDQDYFQQLVKQQPFDESNGKFEIFFPIIFNYYTEDRTIELFDQLAETGNIELIEKLIYRMKPSKEVVEYILYPDRVKHLNELDVYTLIKNSNMTLSEKRKSFDDAVKNGKNLSYAYYYGEFISNDVDLENFINEKIGTDTYDAIKFLTSCANVDSSTIIGYINSHHLFDNVYDVSYFFPTKLSNISYDQIASILFDTGYYTQDNYIDWPKIIDNQPIEVIHQLLNDDRLSQIDKGKIIGSFLQKSSDLKKTLTIVSEPKYSKFVAEWAPTIIKGYQQYLTSSSIFGNSISPEEDQESIDVFNRLIGKKENFELILKSAGIQNIKYSLEDKYEILLKLMSNIGDLPKTIDISAFNDEILSMGYGLVEKIQMYPTFGNVVNNAMERIEPALLQNFIDFMQSEASQNDFDAVTYMTLFFRGINSATSDDIKNITSILSENPDLSEESYKLITTYICKNSSLYHEGANIYNPATKSFSKNNIVPIIASLDDIKQYRKLLNAKCDDLMKQATNLKECKNIYLNKYIGINYDEALEICKRYAHSNDQFLDDTNNAYAPEFVNSIRMIMNIEKTNTIKELYDSQEEYLDIGELIKIDNKLKQLYSKELSVSAKEHSPLNAEYTVATHNGHAIKNIIQ